MLMKTIVCIETASHCCYLPITSMCIAQSSKSSCMCIISNDRYSTAVQPLCDRFDKTDCTIGDEAEG
jgi:hypothetical protein